MLPQPSTEEFRGSTMGGHLERLPEGRGLEESEDLPGKREHTAALQGRGSYGRNRIKKLSGRSTGVTGQEWHHSCQGESLISLHILEHLPAPGAFRHVTTNPHAHLSLLYFPELLLLLLLLSSQELLLLLFLLSFLSFRAAPAHMEVPRLGVKSEL